MSQYYNQEVNSQNSEQPTVNQITTAIATVYVPNQDSGTVSVVNIFPNGTTQKVTDIQVGGQPFAAELSVDKQSVYVTVNHRDLNDSGTLAVIDTANNTVVNTIDLNIGLFSSRMPEGLKATPDGSYIYVANFGSNNISIVDIDKQQVVNDPSLGITEVGAHIDFTPDATQAYVTSPATDEVVIVNLTVNLPVKILDAPGSPQRIFISQDPNEPIALVASPKTGALIPYDTKLGETDTFLISTTGKKPTGVVIVYLTDPDRGLITTAYVTNKGSNNVTAIDLFLNPEFVPSAPNPIKVGSEPQGIAATKNGNFIVVANSGSGTISVIDTTINRVTSTVRVGNTPLWLTILDK
jgi:YVTN family beta-propeller protein